jgi:hypothetical protein
MCRYMLKMVGSSLEAKKLYRSKLKIFLKARVPFMLQQRHQALGATEKVKDRCMPNQTIQRPQ